MVSKHTITDLLFTTKYPEKVIEQYFDNLRVEFDSILAKRKDLPENILSEINNAFDQPQLSWSNAYKIEQYLSHISDEETLETDLKRLLVTYQRHFSEKNYNHYKNELEEIKKGSDDEKEKRSVLLRMHAELHSFYIKRSECRDYGFLTRIRVAFIFLIGIALFLFSLVYCFYFKHLQTSSEMIIITMASGFLGASFSMLVGLKGQLAIASLEDLKILHRQGYILKRAFIGVGAALIAYFLIQSQLLSNVINSALLPELPIKDTSNLIESYKNISSLIIWSFIAGFSEILIPNLLVGVEHRISNKDS